MPLNAQNQTLRDCLWLTVIALLAFLPGLASLPVIDRDEARYAQASVQMIESGDLIDIQFQDQDRYKKPVGAYWAQVGTIALTGQIDDVQRGERAIWTHRLASVIGALIAVTATYFTGLLLWGRREAFAGAALLAVSISLVFEAHQAKTDALLAGACAVALYGASARRAWPTWMGLVIGILLKGPVIITLLSLALITDGLVRRSMDRVRPLLKPVPILAAIALTLPWFVAIGLKSDGAFFAEALGRDFGAKVTATQETHGGWPGYYLLTSLIMFWPGVFALPIAALLAWRQRAKPGFIWLLSWVVPMWVVLECVPTKLPHYTLPLYPALALLCGAGLVHLDNAKRLRVWGAVIAAASGILLIVILTASLSDPMDMFTVTRRQILAAVSLLIVLGGLMAFIAHDKVKGAALCGALFSAIAFGAILPRSPFLDLTPRLVAAVPADYKITSPDYREPSLVYHAGTQTNIFHDPFPPGDMLILFKSSPAPTCARFYDEVHGVNYARGDRVHLVLYETDDCSPPEIKAWIDSIPPE